MMCSARLACVKHAASVHPEPGSNSHKKCYNPVQESAWLFYPLFYCFKVDVVVHLFFEFHPPELRKLLFLSHGWFLSESCLHELSRLFHCSIINVLCFKSAYKYYHNFHFLSTTFLFIFWLKRRRRDLNPRAAVNDLLPFQGSPFGQLGYFSIAALIFQKQMKLYI